MRLAVVPIAAAVVLAAVAVAGSREPTKTGDIIGSVTMRPDRSLHMRLSSAQCDGTVVEWSFDIEPAQANYQSTIDHVGGLRPNETKPVAAWPEPPCPSN
jgi:hypothetical protein